MIGSGVISTGEFEMNGAVSEDGFELYFSRSGGHTFGEGMTIYHSRWVDSTWSEATVSPFSGKFVDGDPFLTRDGSRLYFASKRTETGAAKGDFDLWYVERRGDGWSEPFRLPSPINSPEHDVSPWVTDDGVLWFSSRREGGEGDYDIWYAEPEGDGFGDPVNAGPTVNTLGVEVDVCLTGDSQILLFASHDQPVHFGSGDIYLMARTEDGWVGPYNLGQPVNSEGMECCPSITPDNHLLIFSSTRTMGRAIAPSEGYGEGYEDDLSSGALDSGPSVPDVPGNGLGDLYVVNLPNLSVVQEISWAP
jgi:hypothetical protein